MNWTYIILGCILYAIAVAYSIIRLIRNSAVDESRARLLRRLQIGFSLQATGLILSGMYEHVRLLHMISGACGVAASIVIICAGGAWMQADLDARRRKKLRGGVLAKERTLARKCAPDYRLPLG